MRLRNKKTGEIVERSSIVTLRYKISSCSSSLVEAEEYCSIRQLNEDWEDYSPAEPLIEGRSQRAVLRAAAEFSGATIVTVERYKTAGIVVFDFGGKCRVELKDSGINIKSSGYYTITELCGEEEE